MPFFTALREYTLKRLESIGSADILIGIPSYNNESTIRNVMLAASHGAVKYFPGKRVLIFVSDGGSTDDTRDEAQDVVIDPFIEKLIHIYRGIPGKGSALRAVFEAASRLRVKATVMVDADLRSITPDWIEKLVRPVISDDYDYVAPFYSRSKYDGTITNNIAYYMNRMLYGTRVRQPIGGDFCLSTPLAEAYLKQDVWETDVAKFGVDIWMTTVAITEGYRICQARLGVKLHGKKDPSADLSAMFREVVVTLFTLMEDYEKVWMDVKGSKPVDTLGEAPGGEPEPLPIDKETLVEDFRIGYSQFSPIWKTILDKKDYHAIVELKKAGPHEIDIKTDLWARILYAFAAAFHSWPKNRVKLVNMMIPLYYAQVASFVNETRDMTNEQAEGLVEKYAERFEELKPYLLKKWRTAVK
ncbi:MAG: glycosyltransferase [Thermodesulfobacteriota bacterium]|nr:MAG: glycosyltransferase [Thermodesulfobacteriota bacterium]